MDKFEKILDKAGSRYWGQYFINQFYIKIFTGKYRRDVPEYDFVKHGFPDEQQLALQRENYVALYHEYIHYVHEMSTMAGTTGFYYEMIRMATFTANVDVPNSPRFLGIRAEHKQGFDQLSNTLTAVYGSGKIELSGRTLMAIEKVELVDFRGYVPGMDEAMKIRIPMLYYHYFDQALKVYQQDTILFGKYFIYEGLAHALDQLVAEQLERSLEKAPSSEYVVLSQLKKSLAPDLDHRLFLEIASLSLSYWDAGQQCYLMLKIAGETADPAKYVQEQKEAVKELLITSLPGFEETMDIIRDIFRHRDALFVAVSHLTEKMKAGYRARIENPVFEVDVTYSGHTKNLNNYVPLCDYMYVFEDDDRYMRDFLGTHLDMNTSFDLKILLCLMDYFSSEVKGTTVHACPLANNCNYAFRQNHPDICENQPRLTFDNYTKEEGYCPYSLAIGYTKGQDNSSI